MADQETVTDSVQEPAFDPPVQEPTINDIVNSLNHVMYAMQDVNDKLNEQEKTINEMQPRVSILFDGQDAAKEENQEEKVSASLGRQANSRMSMFQRNVEETSTLAGRHEVIIQRQTPSHSHIYLTSTDLAEYAQFVNRWFDWEIQHGIKLEPALIVSRNVRNQIMYNNDKTDTDFNSLTPAEFCSLMAKETKVFSKVHFAETLKLANRDIKVLMWDSVRPNTHERFFQGILRRQKMFTRTFQILMEANKLFCPALEGKEFGLAQIFLDLIDKNYSKYILAEIPKIKNQNYAKLSDFVDAYVAQAKKHFEAGRAIRLVPYGGNDFKMATQQSKTSNYNSSSKTSTPHTGSRDAFPRSGYRGSRDNNSHPGNRRLNHVDINNEEDDSGAEDPHPWTDVHSDGESDTSDVGQLEDPQTRDRKAEHAEDYVQDHELQVLNDSGGPKDYVKGCVNFALYGNCFNGDACKNAQGHREKVAAETRDWMVRKLTSNMKPRAAPLNRQQRDSVDKEFYNLKPEPSTTSFPTEVDYAKVNASAPRKIVQRERSERTDRI